mmetsp:Transcript_13092/g.52432  ORF Transcript_13092/g.52432 Transcript_13092/m.52432 type:complete len:215 (-) Transcript_13092:21-665(-)
MSFFFARRQAGELARRDARRADRAPGTRRAPQRDVHRRRPVRRLRLDAHARQRDARDAARVVLGRRHRAPADGGARRGVRRAPARGVRLVRPRAPDALARRHRHRARRPLPLLARARPRRASSRRRLGRALSAHDLLPWRRQREIQAPLRRRRPRFRLVLASQPPRPALLAAPAAAQHRLRRPRRARVPDARHGTLAASVIPWWCCWGVTLGTR